MRAVWRSHRDGHFSSNERRNGDFRQIEYEVSKPSNLPGRARGQARRSVSPAARGGRYCCSGQQRPDPGNVERNVVVTPSSLSVSKPRDAREGHHLQGVRVTPESEQ